ncbi:MAG TPA: chromosome segregation protein SMC [Burkholderiales bacterium]|nr:chromosome segregation protein SMC [Burkholderiales bacterium]
MQLTHIKLAGFKSFVDPTHISVPGRLVAVVGPNGCGKSNVIDAVRWVLGESSAKQLRGESMQDVIFNGSGARKPVSRASVELVFDNSLGRAAGPWSQYAEISVKRVLEREGESSYFINNQHVRRRDVADIFLGTGLGGRAYAIIEQGTISRIIEAKPEELRSFLEEAAGVSKYRERRRETELRLQDARENLLRVEDICQELAKQLEHLEAQAEKAGRYQELEAQLKNAQQLLWFTRKRDAAAQRARIRRELDGAAIELEAETARLREAERKVEQLRAEHYAASDRVHAAQGRLYEANAEIARLEQEIQHLRDTRARAERQLAGVRGQIEEQRATLAAFERGRAESERMLGEATQRAGALADRLRTAREALPAAEQAYHAARVRAEAVQLDLARAEQQLELARTRVSHSEKLVTQLEGRRLRLEEERDTLELPDTSELVRLDRELGEVSDALAERREALSLAESTLPDKETELNPAREAAEQMQQRLNQIDARLTALQSLQEQVTRAAGMEPWLERHGLKRSPHLWQGLRIRDGWEDAIEAVLRERLNSVGLDSLDAVQGLLSDPPPGKVSFHHLAARFPEAGPVPAGLARLADYVSCTDSRLAAVLEDWLHGVYVLDEQEHGVKAARELPPGAMLVTAQGHIFTVTSVAFHAADSEMHGILSRQREIEALLAERGLVEATLAEARAKVSAIESEVGELEHAVERLRNEVSELQERQHQIKVDHVRLTQLAERVSSRGTQIVRELEEIAAEAQREGRHATAARRDVDSLIESLAQLQNAVGTSQQAYAAAGTQLQARRDEVQHAEHAHQEASFECRSIEQKITELESSHQSTSQQLARLASEAQRWEEEIGGADEASLQSRLQQLLSARAECETAMSAARDGLENTEGELRETEQQRLAAEQSLAPLRERINDLRLKEQEARLAEESLAQQLTEAHADETALAGQAEKGVRAGPLQSEIARLNGEIAALGAVNLAALEELATARERKNFLDSQSADLTEAMATLENAIRRIDRETRERLQETFEQVNKHFGEMFPFLFGGGDARLVMTGEEILDAGVQVIAQPPGKRNSSIHLLSGGEKALTALALVFSLFQLNPAPFCLLDEVDAPLDDSNTERFCDLVRKMSASTQFLFITHNKITMELAQQLVGVTMQELGVSRVVAVDIEEALRMREEAA